MSLTATPLNLPRLVMRRAAWVAAAVMLLALVGGLLRMNADIDDEVSAAMTLASLVARLGELPLASGADDDAAALASLRALQQQAPLRHLALRVQAADGQELLAPPPEPPVNAAMRALLALHREWLSVPDARQVHWRVARPSGGPWTLTLAASHEAERREAMRNFVAMMALLLAGVAGLLGVMRWNLQRAFAPLGRLLEAIAGMSQHDAAAAVRALPPMPIGELAAVTAALGRLGDALATADARRRHLSQQVLTLQEDERSRLARELHDEMGQGLTALRVDAAWLARRVVDQPALLAVVDGMAAQCQALQGDVRQLLNRLQPFGPDLGPTAGLAGAPDRAVEPSENLNRLVGLLQTLVESWALPARASGDGCRFSLQLQWLGDDDQPVPWPGAPASAALRLPRALMLTLYRISQEALTNVARHAQARHVTLRLQCQGRPQPGAALRLVWSVSDDGLGLAADASQALQRGHGLPGIQERVWAQGGTLELASMSSHAQRPGLVLSALFETHWAQAELLSPPGLSPRLSQPRPQPQPQPRSQPQPQPRSQPRSLRSPQP